MCFSEYNNIIRDSLSKASIHINGDIFLRYFYFGSNSPLSPIWANDSFVKYELTEMAKVFIITEQLKTQSSIKLIPIPKLTYYRWNFFLIVAQIYIIFPVVFEYDN